MKHRNTSFASVWQLTVVHARFECVSKWVEKGAFKLKRTMLALHRISIYINESCMFGWGLITCEPNICLFSFLYDFNREDSLMVLVKFNWKWINTFLAITIWKTMNLIFAIVVVVFNAKNSPKLLLWVIIKARKYGCLVLHLSVEEGMREVRVQKKWKR